MNPILTLRDLLAHLQGYADRCPKALDLPMDVQFFGDEPLPVDEVAWHMDLYDADGENVDDEPEMATRVIWNIGQS